MSEAFAPALPERQVALSDPVTGLEGFIVLHSTALGPAAGGCRLWAYTSLEDARQDALRLAEGMSYKNALAGLPLGGGKAVIVAPRTIADRRALFHAFARAVDRLRGTYLTAEDVGTSVADMDHVAEVTRHVAGRSPVEGKPGGDPSPWTALGVYRAMQVAAERRLGRPLSEVTVAVQGLGHVGFALCELLHAAGARLIVSERRSEVAARAALLFDAEIMGCKSILDAKADIFAPCALGGVLDDAAALRLRAKIVCGAANNQLAHAGVGDRLAERGVLYAPDYVVNAGGIVHVAAEHLGWSYREARTRIDAIGGRLAEVLDLAEQRGVSANRAADDLARDVIAGRVPAAAVRVPLPA